MESTVYAAFFAFSTISFAEPLAARGVTGNGSAQCISLVLGQPFRFRFSISHFSGRLEEQQRDFVACKTRPLRRAAGSHRDVAVRLGSNVFLQFRRKFAEVPSLEANHRPGPRTWQSHKPIAGLSRVRRGPRDAPAFRSQQRRHLLFLLLQTHIAKRLREIFDRKKPICSAHDRDTHRRCARAENVGAMTRGMHPSGMNGRRIFPDGNVLGNVGEPRAGISGPLCKSWLAGELVLDRVEVEHEQSMLPRRFEERVVPLQFWEVICRALLIEQVKQLALGVVAFEPLRLRTSRYRNEKHGNGDETHHEFFHARDCIRSNLRGRKPFHAVGIYPRTRTALKLRTTWPPAVGRPKLSMGLKREKSNI